MLGVVITLAAGGTGSWTPDFDADIKAISGYGSTITISPDRNANFLASDGTRSGIIFARYNAALAASQFTMTDLNIRALAGEPIYVVTSTAMVIELFYEPAPLPITQ